MTVTAGRSTVKRAGLRSVIGSKALAGLLVGALAGSFGMIDLRDHIRPNKDVRMNHL